MNEIKMTVIKVFLLIQYSQHKTNIKKIKLFLDLENWYQKNENKAVFDGPQSKPKGLKRYPKILLGAKIYIILPATLRNFTTFITLP